MKGRNRSRRRKAVRRNAPPSDANSAQSGPAASTAAEDQSAQDGSTQDPRTPEGVAEATAPAAPTTSEGASRAELLQATADRVFQQVRLLFGLREDGADELSPQDARRLDHRARFLVLLAVGGVAVWAYLFLGVEDHIRALLAGEDPLPDLYTFLESLERRRLVVWLLGLVGVALTLWTVALHRRYKLNRVFVALPVPLVVLGLSFDVAVRAKYETELRSVYDRGVALFDDAVDHNAAWDQASAFFAEFRPLVARTFIGDNALGRQSGIAYYQGAYERCIELAVELLESYPGTDIYPETVQTMRWAMAGFAEAAHNSEDCVRLYREHGLERYGISPFSFVTRRLSSWRDLRLDRHDSLDPFRRRLVGRLIEEFPDDPYGPAAAFLGGADDVIRAQFGDTPVGASLVLVDSHEAFARGDNAAAVAGYLEYLESDSDDEGRLEIGYRALVAASVEGSLAEAFDAAARVVAASDAVGEKFVQHLVSNFALWIYRHAY